MANSKTILGSVNNNWTEQKDKLNKRFSNLLEDDSNPKSDKKEEILNKLQIELGTSKEELQKIITVL